MAKSIIVYPYQSLIEDFIKTAESLGHKGSAKLSARHPAILDRQWTQIRGNYNVLASYGDGLGNVVELALVGHAQPVVRQVDQRQTFYGRLRGSTIGWALKAEGKTRARELLATLNAVTSDSSYLIVATQPALGISYHHV